jgi:hypothetical protein
MANINLDLTKLEQLGITPDEYTYLFILYSEKTTGIPLMTDLFKLESLDYIRISEGTVNLKAKGLELFELTDDFSIFVAEYRDLFPKGIKSGNGTPVKGNKKDVFEKMQWFFKTYPEYSKLTILNATKSYIESFKKKGSYTYITQADYLILKEKSSKLASLCEEYDDNSSNSIKTGENRL